MEPSVLVVMGTYNGQKFLENQLISIINQIGVSIKLVVRDDGSTDDTKEILKTYAANGFLDFEVGTNLGFSANYVSLLQTVMEEEWDYLAFSDQDDVWDERKLSVAVAQLRSNSLGMYASKRRILNGEEKSGMIYPIQRVVPTFLNSCFENICAGCTVVISKDFAKMALPYFKLPEARMIPYDSILYIISVENDELYFDQNSYIDYRLHSSNSIGIDLSPRFISSKRINHFREDLIKKIEFLGASQSLFTSSIHQKQLNVVLQKSYSLTRVMRILNMPKLRQNKIQNFLLKIYVAFIGLGFTSKGK